MRKRSRVLQKGYASMYFKCKPVYGHNRLYH